MITDDKEIYEMNSNNYNSFIKIVYTLLFITLGLKDLTLADTPKINPPLAKKNPKELVNHGDVRMDSYYWLREKENLDVISYLNEENSYSQKMLSSMQPNQDKLIEEMKSRIEKKDQSVPVKIDRFYYYTKTEEESEFDIIVRKKDRLSNKEEILLDANQLAIGHSYFKLSNWEASPNHKLMAYATDTVGRRIYTINFKDLESGKVLKINIPNVTSDFVWAEDNRHFFYVKQNPETLRDESVYRLDLKSGKNDLIYYEKDEKFSTHIWKSTSKKFLFITNSSSESSETLFALAKKPLKPFRIFNKRREKHEYSIDHAGSFFYVLSNHQAVNFKIFKTPNEDRTEEKYWMETLPHRNDVLIESLFALKNFLILSVRMKGISEIEVYDIKSEDQYSIPQAEISHVVFLMENPNFKSTVLRYSYQSLVTPSSCIEWDLKGKSKKILKVRKVLGDFDPNNYQTERFFAQAADSSMIPISLVYRKEMKKAEGNPLLLNGYGAYGISEEPYFSSNLLSLLNRGFVFATAHIRGGSEMGRHWYDEGKRFNKKNTFTDFISSAEYLIHKQITNSKKLYVMGGSAGGLLMGAVLNMRPDLFKGALVRVPFVDVLTTMLDETLPLTTEEYEEWGNPHEKEYYNYIKSYSPYDNVKAQDYPHIFVRTGFHDSQVPYWEPAKWVAKLRVTKTDDHLLLLETNMEAGHSGKSGRFKVLEDTARGYAFLLYLEGIK